MYSSVGLNTEFEVTSSLVSQDLNRLQWESMKAFEKKGL